MPNARLIPTNGSPSTVTFLLKVAGNEVPRTYEVLTMVISHEANRVPTAQVVLLDGDPSQEDFIASSDDLFAPGQEIELLIGYESQEGPRFKGVIVAQRLRVRKDGSSQLHLTCKDPAFAMTLGRKSRYFTDTTDSDAMEVILGEYDLEAAVAATEVTHAALVQYDLTDWDFLVSRAEANGRIVVVAGGVVSIEAPDFTQDPILPLQYGATIMDLDVEMDARHQWATTIGHSWDPANQARLDVEGADAGFDAGGEPSAADLAQVGGLAAYDLRHGGQRPEDELKAWADASLLKARLAKLRGRVRFRGFPDMKPGHLLTLSGIGSRFSGTAFVSGVRHDVSQGSWVTDAQLGMEPTWLMADASASAPSAAGLLGAVRGLQIGLVSQLKDDPAGEQRILVKLPLIDADAEGTWARRAALDAGKERGSFFLPEIGDEVIVGFLNDDPRDAVVLGMLHSSDKPAPLEASDDNHQKGFVSREGLKLLFDDEKKSLTLETPAGKIVTLDEDAGVLQLEDEHGNKLLMNSDGITIESAKELTLVAGTDLKIESGVNVEFAAGASFKADGAAGAEITSSAVVKIEGSLVTIN
jgi:Rhs element Vgr protein